MRGLELEAVYVNGVLQLPRQLPLEEGQKVTITIHPPGGVARRGYGRLQSSLEQADLDRAALSPELSLRDSP
jgi:predicted DNA-binding antitoxin AbrB/MazE fold protein